MSDLKSESSVLSAQKPSTGWRVIVAVLGVTVIVMFELSSIPWYYLELVAPILILCLGIAWAIRIRQEHRVMADPSSERFDPGDSGLPEPVASGLRSLVPTFEALGFSAVGHFYRSAIAPPHRMYVTLLFNRKSQQAARFGTVFHRGKKLTRTWSLLGFTTEFTDGTMLVTCCRSEEPPGIGLRYGSIAFPEFHNPRRLHEIHEAAVNRYCSDGIRRDLSNVNPEDYYRESIRRATAALVDTGDYYLDEEQQVLRATWKGAMLMSWKQLRPIKRRRAMLRRRRTARLLRELDLEL